MSVDLVADLRNQVNTLCAALARTIHERDFWRDAYHEHCQPNVLIEESTTVRDLEDRYGR